MAIKGAFVRKSAMWFGVFIVMAIICLPGLWVVLNAFRSNVAILSNQSPLVGASYTLDNFKSMFGYGQMASLPISQYFVNSLIISCVSTIAALAGRRARRLCIRAFRLQAQASHVRGADADTCHSWHCVVAAYLHAVGMDRPARYAHRRDPCLSRDERTVHGMAHRWLLS